MNRGPISCRLCAALLQNELEDIRNQRLIKKALTIIVSSQTEHTRCACAQINLVLVLAFGLEIAPTLLKINALSAT